MACHFAGMHVVARFREPGGAAPRRLRPGGRSWAEGGQPQPTLPAAQTINTWSSPPAAPSPCNPPLSPLLCGCRWRGSWKQSSLIRRWAHHRPCSNSLCRRALACWLACNQLACWLAVMHGVSCVSAYVGTVEWRQPACTPQPPAGHQLQLGMLRLPCCCCARSLQSTLLHACANLPDPEQGCVRPAAATCRAH